VTLPEWVNIPNDPAIRAAWRQMIDTLRLHEEGHVNIFKELVQQLSDGTVIAAGPNPAAAQQAAGRNFNQILKSAREAAVAKQERYDAVTDHGRKQSAVGGTDVRFGCP
jgi:predicted secreted Zn-dependent protease